MNAGSAITIGDPVEMLYDHREQMTVPLVEHGKITETYLIIEEIGLRELMN